MQSRAISTTVASLLGLILCACSDVYVPSAKDLAKHPFIIDGTDVRGIYANRDVVSEVFSYHTAATEVALLARLRERMRREGYEHLDTVGGAYRFRREKAGGAGGDSEVRIRHDISTGTVIVAEVDDMSANRDWADQNVWIFLR